MKNILGWIMRFYMRINRWFAMRKARRAAKSFRSLAETLDRTSQLIHELGSAAAEVGNK